jgi:hypothetical protein
MDRHFKSCLPKNVRCEHATFVAIKPALSPARKGGIANPMKKRWHGMTNILALQPQCSAL